MARAPTNHSKAALLSANSHPAQLLLVCSYSRRMLDVSIWDNLLLLASRVMSSVSSVTSLGGRQVGTAPKLRLNITGSRHPLISSKSPNPHPQKSNSSPSETQFGTSLSRGPFGSKTIKKHCKTMIHSTFSKKTISSVERFERSTSRV